jgi:hypothetical protein
MKAFLDSLDNCSDEDEEKNGFSFTTKDLSYLKISRFTKDFV